MKFLLIPVGSAGDVNPFIGIGLALRDRGHAVTVITHTCFEDLIRQVGLDCIPLGSMDDFDAAISNPDIWHPRRGLTTLLNLVLPLMDQHYRAIQEHYVPGETVVAAAGIALGARCAHEKLGVPLATIHLQPLCLWGAHDPPRLAPLPLPDWLPPGAYRLIYHAVDWVVDRACAEQVNAFRAKLDLPPVRQILHHWWHSPQRVIGLFPDWFAAPQPDWPPQTMLTDFVRYDQHGAIEIPTELTTFLAAGDPPIVFAPGSANCHAKRFFAVAAVACVRLGRRGLFLTPFREQVPEQLPDGVAHFDYLPLGHLLPHAAALVFHGGIGTLAQGMAAGIPQLAMPMSHDQPDNARRLQRLGLGDYLSPRSFRVPAVVRKLDRILNSDAVAEACRAVAVRMQDNTGIAATCDALEQLVGADAHDS